MVLNVCVRVVSGARGRAFRTPRQLRSRPLSRGASGLLQSKEERLEERNELPGAIGRQMIVIAIEALSVTRHETLRAIAQD